MKHIINRNRKSLNINNNIIDQRRASLNPIHNYKIDKNINQEVSAMYKTNKTIQKYINQKLNSLQSEKQKQIIKNLKAKNNKSKSNNHSNHSRNYSINFIQKTKTKTTNKTCKKNINILIKNKNNKIKKGRNAKQDMSLLNKEYKTNKVYSSYNNLPDLPSFSSNNNNNNNSIINFNNYSMKSPLQTKGKLINNFYHNYSSSMSTGISLNNNNEIYKSCSNFLDNNSFHKIDSTENENENENLDKEYIPIFKNNLKINGNEDRNNNTTNNYEIDSSEDNMIDNKIYLKAGGNGSPITFGNSFSYTNSKRSSSTRRVFKNNDIDTSDIKDDDNSVFLLKSQNETLKKELKESNEQIIYLKNEIEKLIKKKKVKNYKCCVQLNKCNKPKPHIKKYSKNNSCSDHNLLEINNNYHSHEAKKMKKNGHFSISKNKKNKVK
jgi:hypothetical protein